MNNGLFRLFRNNEIKVHELNYLFWECTTRCNLHCRHCGSDCTSIGTFKDMPLKDFLDALDTIPHNYRPKGFTIVLTGGEPLLRPDIVQVGKSIRSRGFGWGMVSNGFFYDEVMNRKLIDAGMGALTISLDGIGEDHNWMRGNPQSYERAVRAIAIAAKEKNLDFDVVTCVNKRNIGKLDDMLDLLSDLGVRRWRLFTIIPIGRAADDPEMQLSDGQLLYLMNHIAEQRKSGGQGKTEVTFSCEGYLGPFEGKVRRNPFFCRAGINIASVLIDGSINACPNIDRKAFRQGNIHEDNLYDVWENGFRQFRAREWTKTGICSDCPVWEDCQGNGMHNWHGNLENVLTCHYSKIMNAKNSKT